MQMSQLRLQKRNRLLTFVAMMTAMLITAACGTQSTGPRAQPDQSAGQSQAGPSQPKTGPLLVNMASTTNTSSHYPYAVALGQSIEKGTNRQVQVNVLPGAGAENLRRLKRGEVAIGLITTEAADHAHRAVGTFQNDTPYETLRILFVYVATPILINVRADSGVKTFWDLEGKRVNPGVPGSAAVAQVKAIANILGVNVNWVDMDLADAVDATKNGRLVGFVKSAASPLSPDATFLDISTLTEMRLVGIPPESKERLEKEIPAFKTVQVPGGIYKGHPDPLLFGGNMVGYAVDQSMSVDVVYSIVKAVFDNRNLQNEAMPGIKGVDYLSYTIEYSTVPLHAGAIRYFKEIGAQIPDHLVPPEAR